MPENYSPEERRSLAAQLRQGAPLRCPACGHALARSDVPPERRLPYVRRRVLLVCPACKRSAALDREAGGKA